MGIKDNLSINLKLQPLQQEPLSTMTEKIWFKTMQRVWNKFSHCDSSNSRGLLCNNLLTTSNSPMQGWISYSEVKLSSSLGEEEVSLFLVSCSFKVMFLLW